MLKLTCQAYDVGSNPIDGGCGDVEYATIDLKYILDKVGEGRKISLSTDGKFFFTKEQESSLPKMMRKSEIIDVVNVWCKNATMLFYADCPNKGCKHIVKISHSGV